MQLCPDPALRAGAGAGRPGLGTTPTLAAARDAAGPGPAATTGVRAQQEATGTPGRGAGLPWGEDGRSPGQVGQDRTRQDS